MILRASQEIFSAIVSGSHTICLCALSDFLERTTNYYVIVHPKKCSRTKDRAFIFQVGVSHISVGRLLFYTFVLAWIEDGALRKLLCTLRPHSGQRKSRRSFAIRAGGDRSPLLEDHRNYSCWRFVAEIGSHSGAQKSSCFERHDENTNAENLSEFLPRVDNSVLSFQESNHSFQFQPVRH